MMQKRIGPLPRHGGFGWQRRKPDAAPVPRKPEAAPGKTPAPQTPPDADADAPAR
jgi:hypothetical protein